MRRDSPCSELCCEGIGEVQCFRLEIMEPVCLCSGKGQTDKAAQRGYTERNSILEEAGRGEPGPQCKSASNGAASAVINTMPILFHFPPHKAGVCFFAKVF